MKRMTAAAAAAAALTTAGLLAASAGPAVAGPAVAGPAVAVNRASGPAAAAPPGGPVPAGFKPASVTFVSASEGWVLGTAPCAHKPCTSVLRTANGGRSWVGIPAPKYPLAKTDVTSGLLRMRFADASDGFAYGSQLWVTHDGGARWHRVRQVPGYVTDLEASAGIVYATTVTAGHLAVYSSPANRDFWHRVTALPRTAGTGGLGTITLHGRAAWIILANRLYSTRTGSGWVRDTFRCQHGWGLSSVAAFSARRITALCSGEPALGSTLKKVYESADGGTHFAKVGAPPQGGDGGLLAEPTASHLFVATSSGATWLYVSNDGGRHWHQNLMLDDGGLGWNDFGFTTATQGVAIEGTPFLGSHLYLSRDAGGSWHKVKF